MTPPVRLTRLAVRYATPLALGMAVAVLALVWLSGQARAHGSADWIMAQPRYVDRNNSHCCGPSDCAPVACALIHESNDWLEFEGERIRRGEKGVYWSQEPAPPDGQQRCWACRASWPAPDGRRIKCLFRRQPGS